MSLGLNPTEPLVRDEPVWQEKLVKQSHNISAGIGVSSLICALCSGFIGIENHLYLIHTLLSAIVLVLSARVGSITKNGYYEDVLPRQMKTRVLEL